MLQNFGDSTGWEIHKGRHGNKCVYIENRRTNKTAKKPTNRPTKAKPACSAKEERRPESLQLLREAENQVTMDQLGTLPRCSFGEFSVLCPFHEYVFKSPWKSLLI